MPPARGAPHRLRAALPMGALLLLLLHLPLLLPLLLLLLPVAAPGSRLDEWSLEIDLSAPSTLLFNHSADACYQSDVIDETLNAFRTADGRIRMVAGNGGEGPCSFVGDSLLSLKRDCETGPVLRSRSDYNGPADFPHNMWLPATYAMDDGVTVYGLAHDEFHAGVPAQHPRVPASLCEHNVTNQCWYSSVISVISTDGGRSFQRVSTAERPNAVAIAAPIVYRPDAGVQGVPAHRHVVRSPKDGFWYVMPSCAYLSQLELPGGKCVFRTANISDPFSWVGWNGSEWSVSTVDPYTTKVAAEDMPRFTAAAVGTRLTGGLTWVESASAFLILGTTSNEDKLGQVEYQWSEDLLSWSPPRVLVRLNHTDGIRDGKGALYPTVLDPSDTSRNFERFGSAGHIYWLEFACASEQGECWNRNVVWRPLRVVRRAPGSSMST